MGGAPAATVPYGRQGGVAVGVGTVAFRIRRPTDWTSGPRLVALLTRQTEAAAVYSGASLYFFTGLRGFSRSFSDDPRFVTAPSGNVTLSSAPDLYFLRGVNRVGGALRRRPQGQGAIVNSSPNVVERYVSDLRRYARVLSAGRGDADDLVQECLARALARPNFPADIRNVRAYLFTVLHNVHVDQVSRRAETSDAVDFDEIAGSLPQPAAQPAAIELRDLARALDSLPEEQHRVVMLVGLEGLTYEETAQVLDLPIGTVMSRLSRGREALRRMTDGRQSGGRRAAARA